MLTPAERQRRYRERRDQRSASLDPIPCACGCEQLIPPINKQGRPATFAHGHNSRGKQPAWTPEHMARMRAAVKTPWTQGPRRDEIRARIAESVKKQHERQRANGYIPKRGWKHSEETRQRFSEAVRKRDLRGARNPFFGRTHTPETRARLSERLSGEGNPGWNGGASTLPYGPEFTRKFKRLIRERDGHICQRCGKTREENSRRTMQVHHRDHDKMNNDPTNLTTVCNSCNVWLSHHRDVKI